MGVWWYKNWRLSQASLTKYPAHYLSGTIRHQMASASSKPANTIYYARLYPIAIAGDVRSLMLLQSGILSVISILIHPEAIECSKVIESQISSSEVTWCFPRDRPQRQFREDVMGMPKYAQRQFICRSWLAVGIDIPFEPRDPLHLSLTVMALNSPPLFSQKAPPTRFPRGACLASIGLIYNITPPRHLLCAKSLLSSNVSSL